MTLSESDREDLNRSIGRLTAALERLEGVESPDYDELEAEAEAEYPDDHRGQLAFECGALRAETESHERQAEGAARLVSDTLDTLRDALREDGGDGR